MARISFSHLPDDARLWIFPVSRPLAPREEEGVLSRVDAFLDGWAAHGAPLRAGRDLREGRFLMVGVDEASVPPSGCSIDALVGILKEEGEKWGVDFLDHGPVWFRSEEEIRRVPRLDFKAMADRGEVGPETPVFDNTVTRLAQLRRGGWEKPASESWHGRAFFGS